jgi:hypothetical protein
MGQIFSFEQEHNDQKYMCCQVIEGIYLLMEEPWIPQLLKYKTELPKEKNIPQNVQKFLINKKENPQYIRTAIKYEHNPCLYELLRFDFDPYLALKTAIRFDRFYLIDLFVDRPMWCVINGALRWTSPLTYVPVQRSFFLPFEIKNDDTHDDTITKGYVLNRTREIFLDALTFVVLCGSHKTVPFLLTAYKRINYEKEHPSDEENPLHLSIIKGDLYLAKMLRDKKYPSFKRFFDKYIQTCSTEQKEQIESFIEQLELNKNPHFYTK